MIVLLALPVVFLIVRVKGAAVASKGVAEGATLKLYCVAAALLNVSVVVAMVVAPDRRETVIFRLLLPPPRVSTRLNVTLLVLVNCSAFTIAGFRVQVWVMLLPAMV